MAVQFENLEKKLDDLTNQVKGFVSQTHVNGDRGVVSFMEDDPNEESVVVKGGNMVPVRRETQLRNTRRFLKAIGYKSEFSTKEFGGSRFGGMLKLMARNESEYKTRVGRALETLRKAADQQGITKASAINTLDSESAGLLVLPEFAPEISELVYDNQIMSMCDQYVVSGNTMRFPKVDVTSRKNGKRSGGIQGLWPEEGDPGVPSRPKFSETELRLKKLVIVVYLTEEMLDDNAYTLEQWVRRAVNNEISFMTGDAIFNGDGVGKPLGFLQSPALVTIAKENAQLANTIVPMNIEKMYSRMRFGQGWEGYRFFINQDTYPQLNLMTVGSGGSAAPVFLPAGNMATAPFGSLKGIPIIPTEFNSTLGTAGDVALANLARYLVISKAGIQESVSTHVEFLRDQTAFKFTFRIDGRPLYDAPTEPYKGLNTQSDFLTIETRN
jgi:HK97 family phage major capsid protein